MNTSLPDVPFLQSGLPPPPPPGLNYIAVITPALTALLVSATLSAVLVPLLFALFWFSTRELRRKPVFTLNVLAVLLCMTCGSLSMYLQINNILRPQELQLRRGMIASSVFTTVTPVYVESLLLLRLLAVYPFAKLPKLVLLIVYGPPVAIQIARIINVSITMNNVADLFFKAPNVLEASERAWQVSGTKVEICLQVVDNAYISTLFLCKVYKARSRALTWRSDESSYSSRLRSLLYIATSNFVLPVMINLTQLIFLFADSNESTGIYIMSLFFVNNTVQVICLVATTVWAATNHRSNSSITPTSSHTRGTRSDTLTMSHGRIINDPDPRDSDAIVLQTFANAKVSSVDLDKV